MTENYIENRSSSYITALIRAINLGDISLPDNKYVLKYLGMKKTMLTIYLHLLWNIGTKQLSLRGWTGFTTKQARVGFNTTLTLQYTNVFESKHFWCFYFCFDFTNKFHQFKGHRTLGLFYCIFHLWFSSYRPLIWDKVPTNQLW